jgi:hypothetical protein
LAHYIWALEDGSHYRDSHRIVNKSIGGFLGGPEKGNVI